MSTRANVVINDGKKTKILYHHHDGDELGTLLKDFIEGVVTSDADDFSDFLKDYTNPGIGYNANGFEDAKVVNTDIDYIYFVTIYPEHRFGKVVEGFKFPHPKLHLTGGEVRGSDGELYDGSIYDKFSSHTDFTYRRVATYWKRSFYFIHGIPEEIIGGAPKPKED